MVTENPIKIGADVRAEVGITPKRSQVYVITIAIIAAFCLAIGFDFLWKKPEISWVPLLFSIGLFGLSYKTWSKSHRNIDLSGGIPTTIRHGEHGTEISTDPRSLDHPNMLLILADILSMLGYRKPLPDPSGLVTTNGTPLPDKKNEAVESVQQLNKATEELTEMTIKYISFKDREKLVEQPAIQGPTDIPALNVNLPIDKRSAE